MKKNYNFVATKILIMEDLEYKEGEATEPKGKVRWCNIEMLNNGFIVRFDVMEERDSKSMEHCSSVSKGYVFREDQEDEAWDYYRKIKMIELKG